MILEAPLRLKRVQAQKTSTIKTPNTEKQALPESQTTDQRQIKERTTWATTKMRAI